VELITSLKDLTRPTGAYFNARIGVAPDGSAVFTRDIGTEEIYARTVSGREWLPSDGQGRFLARV
jgi:hypothetical protein